MIHAYVGVAESPYETAIGPQTGRITDTFAGQFRYAADDRGLFFAYIAAHQ